MNFTADKKNMRLDIFLCEKFSDWSRSHIQKIITDGKVKVDEKTVKPSYKLDGGENISVAEIETVETEYLPENLPLNILYEDADIIVVNKARGMTVHPADTVSL